LLQTEQKRDHILISSEDAAAGEEISFVDEVFVKEGKEEGTMVGGFIGVVVDKGCEVI
jgi:hypothetical protein